jgi:acetate kinase
MDTILTVNTGSSSLKFRLYGIGPSRTLTVMIRGQVEGVGTHPRLRADTAHEKSLIDQTFAPETMPDVATAIQAAAAWLRDTLKVAPIAVAHRVVHGGPDYDRPVLVDETVLAKLARYEPLAPLHQPNNLAPIRSLLKLRPDLPQVACFDTAFHRGHGPMADRYAIPEFLYAEGVRRYGFHGLSYEYVAGRLREVAPAIAAGRVIIAHLGSGASMCALSNGHGVESTMGFTALDGLPTGTRPGQIDPGLVLYLIAERGMSAEMVQALLYHEYGLKGLSGISNDVRDLETSNEPAAAMALEYFAYRVGLHAAMLAAALGGIDAFVFTAGIGEHSPTMRARIAEKLNWLGVELDPVANYANQLKFSRSTSRVAVYVVPTDEELMIAKHTLALLSSNRALNPAHQRAI